MISISSLLGSIKRITIGNQDPALNEFHGSDEDDDADPSDIEIPQINSGTQTFPPPPPPPEENKNHHPANEEKADDAGVERIHTVGFITAFDLFAKKGVIDRQFQFDTDKFCPGNTNFDRGSKVEFDAERTRQNPQWLVTSMKMYETNTEKINKERMKHRTVMAQVKRVHRSYIEVETNKNKANLNHHIIKVPNRDEFKLHFEWMEGDWMQISLESVTDETNEDPDLAVGEIRSKVVSVTTVQQKTVVGKVTKRHNHCLIDDSIYYTVETAVGKLLPLGTLVRCVAILSTQPLGNDVDFVNWRAIEINKSNFLHYTTPEATGDKEDGRMLMDGGEEIASLRRDLYMDKCGIKIFPSYLNFRTLTIGDSAHREITVSNRSQGTLRMKKCHFTQDSSVCQFELRSPQLESDGGLTLLPEDEIKITVYCRPLMIGTTKEMCVFDFGTFSIARDFLVTGKTEAEDKLRVDASKERPAFKKQIGEKDLTQIITDRERRRVRGPQVIRAPFFSQKRLPLYKVPSEMWKILKDQDEQGLNRRYPTALTSLRFENYRDKFMVSLWFEEMENDLRRRQFDLSNVVLTRHGSYYTFHAPGIQEFQPSVNIQDAIDVFDPETSGNAKYQGSVIKIFESEVTCIFGEAFTEQYTGYPLTVQFCLGRTNYKRCHFAVETAIDYLGKGMLFPEELGELKTPRISTYEVDEEINQLQAETEEKTPMLMNNKTENHSKWQDSTSASSIFNKPKQQAIYRPSVPDDSNGHSSLSVVDCIGKRVPSARSRFVSDTPSTPSCTTAKLEWFNTHLNEEQKNAVRRILRGQARPIPYIIYGPPGTGKTVTMVETVMQVNKLDTNSRILVCAPSNAAADVIAEYLINSNQYHPGDFVRLNGFLRAGQSTNEAIVPFCVDGDDLINVAMHRLIISTCTTAGQFFTLDLSIGHFTHVFIDEAGYCTEPEALIPAILLALSKGGQLILAGDPNQLGPVLMSDVAQNCGLGRSLLERLMTTKLYCRDPDRFPKEKYNPLVLTKLVKNYRAHQTLLKLPSRLFYDDDLESEASFEEAYSLCEDPKLNNILVSQGVPLIFHGVQGLCTRERDSPSWCNKAEAVQVVHYVASLVRNCGLSYDDIGIITPYRKQVEKIRLALQMNLLDDDLPKVASVEEFQGGEKKVIIISTVRSVHEDKVDNNLERLGFLYQPKRFNVAITRAKALMIVVGNPHVLARNNFWKQLLQYAIELDAYKGCNLPPHLDQKVKQILKTEQDRMNDTSPEMNGTAELSEVRIARANESDFEDGNDF